MSGWVGRLREDEAVYMYFLEKRLLQICQRERDRDGTGTSTQLGCLGFHRPA